MKLFYKVLMKALLVDSCLYICESDGFRETTSIVINSETSGTSVSQVGHWDALSEIGPYRLIDLNSLSVGT